jgi:hypothetical protein
MDEMDMKGSEAIERYRSLPVVTTRELHANPCHTIFLHLKMKASILTSWFSLQLALTGVVALPQKGEQARASAEIANLQEIGNQYITSKISGHGQTCNAKNIVRRQEWYVKECRLPQLDKSEIIWNSG